MNAQCVCVSSRTPAEPYYRLDCYLSSLHRYAEVPTNIGEGRRWDGLMTKPFLLREWLRAKQNTSDYLIFTDAWDVLFVQHPHGLGDRAREWFGEDTLVWNGERNLWPRGDLKDEYDALLTDAGPWKYLNSGVLFGKAALILELLESMDIESIGVDRREPDGRVIEPNDQGEYQAAFLKQAVPQVIDTNCRLAMTFSATEFEDYEIADRECRNLLTGTTPGILHFNGDGMNKHFQRFLDHWELP